MIDIWWYSCCMLLFFDVFWRFWYSFHSYASAMPLPDSVHAMLRMLWWVWTLYFDSLCWTNPESREFFLFLYLSDLQWDCFLSHLISKIKDIQRLWEDMGSISKELHYIHGVCWFWETPIKGWSVVVLITHQSAKRAHRAGKWQHMTTRKGCLHCGFMLAHWICDIFWSHDVTCIYM